MGVLAQERLGLPRDTRRRTGRSNLADADSQPSQAPPPGVAQLPEELPQETKDLIPTAYKEVDGGASADGRKTWATVMEDGGQMALPSPRGSKRSPRRLTICGRHS